jgi:hypothetical protein
MSNTYTNFVFDGSFLTPQFRSTVNTPSFKVTPEIITATIPQSRCYNSPCDTNPPACGSDITHFYDYSTSQSTTLCPPNTIQTDITAGPIDCHDCSGGAYWSNTSNYCYADLTESCQSPDPSMCTISANVLGTCGDSCQKGTSFFANTQGGPGWINCNYTYLFDKSFSYQTGYSTKGYVSIGIWISELYKYMNSHIGTQDIVNLKRVRDCNFIYACIYDFYNQLYHQNGYSSDAQNFQKYTMFLNKGKGQNAVNKNINDRINDIYNLCNGIYTDSDIANIKNIIQNSCLMPKINQSQDNVYTITFYLSLDLFRTYQGTDINYSSVFLEECINNMLGNNNLIININNNTNSQYSVKLKTKYTPPSTLYDTLKMIKFQYDTTTNNTNYIIEDGGNTKSLFDLVTDVRSNTNMLLYFEVTAEILEWSPTLIIYAKTFSNMSFSPICNKLEAQFPKIPIPIECLNISNMNSYCDTYINGYISSETINLYLANNSSVTCNCYTSSLGPADESQINNTASMCFSTNCTNDKTLFGLDDLKCKNYCPTVWAWFNENNPNAQLPSNPSEMDWVKFKKLCNYNFTPYLNQQINKTVLILGVLVTLVCTFYVFSFCNYNKYNITIKILISIIIFTLFSILTWSLAKNYAGNGQCEDTSTGSKFVCKNQKGNIIPDQFCSSIIQCECTQDSDCNFINNGQCVSNVCFTNNDMGSRVKKDVTNSDVNISYLVASLITFILLPISIYMFIGNDTVRNYIYTISFSLLFVGVLFIVTKQSTKLVPVSKM